MFVVVWEPRSGAGGGHQLALERRRAEYLSRAMCRALPDAEVKILTAEAHAAAAVVERQEQQQRGPYGASQRRPERSGQRT